MKDRAVIADVGALYVTHQKWLHAWLLRRTRCSQRASDLAQDTFCRLLERTELAVPVTPRGFLATVARRLLIDDVRRRDLERAYIDSYALFHGDCDPLTPERFAEATQLLHGLVQVLADIPDSVRLAFLLRRIDGLPYEEIASELKVSVRTAKRHVAQAYVHCYRFAEQG